VLGAEGQTQEKPSEKSPVEKSGLTKYVAEFVLNLKYEDIPADVVALGKKSILDGFGLALAGSMAESGPISRKYAEAFGGSRESSTLIGSSAKSSPRFAAFVNGVSIHADDFDDTQLAIAKDRVYGLLTHPTGPVLPAAFAIAENKDISGRELMAAYFAGVEVETKIAEAIAPRGLHSGCLRKRSPIAARPTRPRWPARQPSGPAGRSFPTASVRRSPS